MAVEWLLSLLYGQATQKWRFLGYSSFNKISAVAEMGDRGHKTHEPKKRGLLCPFRGSWDPV